MASCCTLFALILGCYSTSSNEDSDSRPHPTDNSVPIGSNTPSDTGAETGDTGSPPFWTATVDEEFLQNP